MGRSFHDIGAAIKDARAAAAGSLGNSGETAGFWKNLKNNLSSKEYGGKDWKKNSLNEIVSKENIDSYIPELDINTAQGKLEEILDWQKKIENSKKNSQKKTRNRKKNRQEKTENSQKTWQDYYSTLGKGEQYITDLIKNTGDLSKLTGEDLVNANQAARNAALAHNEALKSQTLSAQAGKIGFQALATAGNMLLFTAVTEGIQFVTKAIDDWIHADEIALEKAEAAQARIDGINSTYKAHRDAAGELGASYDKLAKGVDTSTNTNLSLSNEDYKSYLDTTNRLAETFPTLKTGLDENGNALLSLGQNGRTASEDLAELLKTEEELNNYEISQDIDALFAGVSIKLKDAESNVVPYSRSQEALNNAKQLLEGDYDLSEGIRIAGDMSDRADSEYYNAVFSALQNVYGSLDENRQMQLADILDPGRIMAVDSSGKFDFYLNSFLLTPQEQQLLQDEIKLQAETSAGLIEENIDNALMEQSDIQRESELAWKDFLPSLTAAMKSQSTFKSLGEGAYGEDIQNFAIGLVSSLDSSVAEEMGKSGGAYEWIRDHFLFPLTQLNDSDRKSVVDAYNRLLELNPDDLSQQNQSGIDHFTGLIAEKLGLDSGEIRLNLGFEVDEDLKSKYDTAITDGLDKFGGSRGGMENTFTELGIDTAEEIDSWNEITANARNAAEAVEMYKNAKKSGALPFSEAWAALDTTEDSALKNELLSLAETGQLTVESFNDLDGSDSFLSLLGLGADDTDEIQDVIANINELASSTEQLASMKKGISGLSENLYARQQNPGTAIGAETFSGMDAGLKAQTAEWNNYVSVLGNASSSTAEVQAATDKLAAAYINSSNFLANLTEANKGYYTSQLEAMGVANAEELLQESLTRVP